MFKHALDMHDMIMSAFVEGLRVEVWWWRPMASWC